MLKKQLYAGAALFFGLVLMGAGCTQATETSSDDATPSTSSAELVSGEWVDDSAQGDIADTPLAGTINSEDVTIAHVQVDYDGTEYNWSFSDTDNTSTCSFQTGDNEVNFRAKDMQKGTFYKETEADIEFDDYHSYYVYAQENGSPYSVNTDWGATIVVTDIQQGLEEGTFGESVGTVTGFADISFADDKTALSGSFVAELCEDIRE